ncbi:MFS transporter [Sedimentibacter sp. zth1]|uniref:MFS transporter n=1 Tax=Sedimentibacter sp. zth1 TaxID=2816908 RepID=UPI001A926C60|nr:MFS transporter [Sedimentibacter sp. zth1]QSX06889.1 MFS transporter [Sedimentibacter sp. zth1]
MEPKKLMNKNFVLMLQGNFISAFGDILYSIAIGYFVYHSTGSESMMGIFTSIGLFVTMFLSPISGALVDRINRKIVVVGMDFLRGVIMIILGILCLNDRLNIGFLVVMTVIISLSNVLFRPAATTILVDIVPRKDFVQANSIVSSALNVVDLISKGISGYLLVYVGIGQLIVFNGISFLISALSEYFVCVPKTPKQGTKINFKIILQDLKIGFKSMLSIKGLNALFCLAIFINFFAGGIFGLILLVTTEKGFSLEQYGLLMSIISIGGLLGALFVSIYKIPSKKRPTYLYLGFIISSILFAIGFTLHSFIALAVIFLIGIFLNTLANMLLNASFMLLIPNDKRAAILGFLTASSMGGMALSTVMYGILAEIFSISMLASIGFLITIIPLLFLVKNKQLQQILIESGESPSENTSSEIKEII